jgi:hypothetical protein
MPTTTPIVHDDNAPYYQRYKEYREKNPHLPENMGKRWTVGEKESLERELREKMPIRTIATTHGRTKRAIEYAIANLAAEMTSSGHPIEEVMEITSLSADEVNSACETYVKRQEEYLAWKSKTHKTGEHMMFDVNSNESHSESSDHELHISSSDDHCSDSQDSSEDLGRTECVSLQSYLSNVKYGDFEYVDMSYMDTPVPLSDAVVPFSTLGEIKGGIVTKSEDGYHVSFVIVSE